MGAVNLELRCPQSVHGITVDPEPDWNFDSLLSELSLLEKNLNGSSTALVPFKKTESRSFTGRKGFERSQSAFIMHISDDDEDDMDDDGDENLVVGRRFACDELYLSDSDDSEVDSTLEGRFQLMEKVGAVENALVELTYEHELKVKEEIRNSISALEVDLMSESGRSTTAFVRLEKYKEARRELDRKHDIHYQRKIAEALDNHLTAIQRDHELRSQIEERRIRSDAAFEEAKRKEKALQEEKLRQDKAKAEAEIKLRVEEAKKATFEAETRAAKEAAEREAIEISKRTNARVGQEEVAENQMEASLGKLNAQPRGSGSDGTKQSLSEGSIVRAAQSVLKLEQERLQKLKEFDDKNRAFSTQDFSSYERRIGRLISQIRGTKKNVRDKATELMKIFKDPSYPVSASVATFVKKVVSHCDSPVTAAFACSHVIVLVSSQIPYAMDLLLAELHKACIYTVPKHMLYSKSAFESKEAYYKALGFRDNGKKIESVEDYLKRLESYMKLYGALIQTEVEGVQNAYGLKEGWAWLARFLNALPANRYTAVALNAFLQTAGFALHRNYKSQFRKMLDIIFNDFLNALKARKDPEMNSIIIEINSYIEDKKFEKEPEGRILQDALLSSVMVPESGYQQSHWQQTSRYY